MSVPPDMMAALQGAAGPQGGDPSMMGGAPAPAPEAPAEDGGSLYGQGGGDNVEALRAALDALQQYAQEEDDDQNIQVVLKCLTALQAILADEQKMMDGALGGKVDARGMRRLGGQAGQQAGGGPSY